MPGIITPIKDRLPAGTPRSENTQLVYHTVVHILIPTRDRFGQPISSPADAERYLTEILSEEFLDWNFAPNPDSSSPYPHPLHTLESLEVSDPYVVGSFLSDDAGPDDDPFIESVDGYEDDFGVDLYEYSNGPDDLSSTTP